MFCNFIRSILKQKHLIVSLAKRDILSQYAGSLLGFVWAFIHPVVMIFVFWVVFSVGFRAKPMNDVPFVVWLCAGMAGWFLFSEIVASSCQVIVNNAPLIKKTLFPSQILPVVKLASCLVNHAVFLLVLIVLIVLQGMSFSFYYLQFIYYLLCLMSLGLGIGWACAALNVFIRDIGQIVNVILQVGFWATPVLWDINIMPPKVQLIMKLNPMFYVVQGYRESFVSFKPFWLHPVQTIYFWVVTLMVLAIGAIIFKKLKPQFPDAL